MYQVHSTVHHPSTRTKRAQAPIHYRHKQFILASQRRLIPNRPITIDEDELKANLEELRALHEQGRVEVRLLDGTKFDLATLTAGEKAVTVPQPVHPDDSAKFDPPVGKDYVTHTAQMPAPPDPPVEEGQAAGMVFDPVPPGRKMQEDDFFGVDPALEGTEATVTSVVEQTAEGQKLVSQEVTPVVSSDELANAFGGPTEEEEEDAEHVEAPSAPKPKRSRRR